MAHYWQMLLKLDAILDITSAEAVAGFFAEKIAARDGALDIDEIEQATHAMGLAKQLVGVLAQTPGYQCPGTRTHDGHNIVLAGTATPPQTYVWLFDSVNIRYGTQWAVLAAQPYEPQLTGETVTDEDGNATPVRAVVPYRAVPQAIRPWLARDVDIDGAEIQDDPLLTPSRLGGIQGAAEWVVESAQ